MSAEQTVRLDGSSTITTVPSGVQTVSGTVTALPSGTQAVSGTVTTVPSGTQNVAITGQPIATTPGAIAGQNFYFYNLQDAPGVVAANNFLSIFNPAGSGKNITAYQVIVNPWAAAAATTDVSMT